MLFELGKSYCCFVFSNDPDYKGVLSTTVKTKTLTEDERKMLKAEQQDFRSSLVRKVGGWNQTF